MFFSTFNDNLKTCVNFDGAARYKNGPTGTDRKTICGPRYNVMENGVDEKGHMATRKVENTPLRNDTTEMEVESKDLLYKEDAELKADRDIDSEEADVDNREMDVDNRDTDIENVEVNMVEDSASDEDDICTPPDANMDVNVSCDDECGERMKKFVDLPRCESDYMTEEEDDPDDLYKPEGTIYLDIDGFSQFCKGSPETQQRLSKPVFVRGLPWKILAIPRDAARVGTGTRPNKALGFFLQCNGDSDAVAWNCIASASLKVLGQLEGYDDHSRRITHTFYPKENDWGYSQFLTCDHLINPENGFIKDDTIRLVVHVSADAPHGGTSKNMPVILDSKIRELHAVYDMPVSQDDSENNVALAMQRVFYDLQHSDRPVGTKKLTKSFGWDSLETFMQHDVQELCRVLLDNLESKMKKSPVEQTIPNLFRGVMKSYIRCTNVCFESSKEEPFYDIQLNIKGKNNIMQSFREYVQVERLDGENKYDAGDYGMQPAEKGVKFVSFPPVLHLQLMRFQYDATLDANVKINDKFAFPDKLCLKEFMEGNGEDYTYCLHAVLVHSGDFHGGHYVVFINTGLRPPGEKYKPKWCKFDDDVVSRATVREAVMANYGGDDGESTGRTYTNAYMLVYMVTDEQLASYNGFDLVDPKLLDDTGLPREKIEKSMTIPQLYDYVKLKLFSNERDVAIPAREMFRIWKFEETTYKDEGSIMSALPRLRPTSLIPHSNETQEKTLDTVLESDRNLLYIEMSPSHSLRSYNENSEMLMFLKYYDEQSHTLRYVGHFIVAYRQCMSAYTNECLKLIGLPENTPLRFYEEVAPDRIRLIESLGKPLCADNTVVEVSDGGLLIAERQDRTNDTNNAKLHLDTLYNTIDIEAVANNDSFVSNHAELDPPITGTIGLNWNMRQLVDYIGKEINYDPAKILLWRVSPFNDRATQFLTDSQCKGLRVNGLLGLAGAQLHDPRRNKRYRVVYTKMPIPIADMERKRQMKIQMMDEKMNITEITIFPEKIGTVRDILEEAKREFKFAANGTGKLRLVYVGQSSQSMRAYMIFKEDTSVMEVFQKTMTPSMYMGRVEEVPQDQLVVKSNEYLVPIAHFDKDPGRMFGVPFFLKVSNDELLSSVRERIQARLDIPDKEYEKYKFALISSSRVVRYLDMTSNGRVNLAELGHAHVASLATSPYLGLDHMNKSRGARGSHAAEKAIVIHN
ncbi:MATH domain protein [Dictyocaulus viviparus]|uniref:Ubiquitin carboxyl-terminal hydrolase 7 n=1 Tax=Dictyocaulus viviparus TaxID=29172 RepID=A0A0D8XKY9_DICVI|nr:MATH domain protein [Dictyocaulus viviparus]